MRILHLSDTSLSGAPQRISALYDKYSGHKSRHIQWEGKTLWREYDFDMIGKEIGKDRLQEIVDSCDIIHLHNIYKRQNIFQQIAIPKKKMVLQIHSPKDSLDVSDAILDNIPLAVVAQYHVRQWPHLRFIVPNVVDIYDPRYMPIDRPVGVRPIVSYTPSNANGNGWNNKSYGVVAPILKRMSLSREIEYRFTFNKPHRECLERMQGAHIGIDEVSTGSYHLNSLEYLSMGIACIGYLDEQTTKVVKDLTGCAQLPWAQSKGTIKQVLLNLIANDNFVELGKLSRNWMEEYWDPKILCQYYTKMYEAL